MSENPISIDIINDLVVEVRSCKVLLDRDVAQIYAVETRDINKAVSNNSDKFPVGYVLTLTSEEKKELVENFHRFNAMKHSAVAPKAFTEKGLYMLATILKSKQATQATFAIIETFAKIRELSGTIKQLSNVKTDEQQKELMQKSGELIAEIFDDELETNDTETSIELNFAVLKFKHTVKRKKNERSTNNTNTHE